MQHCLQFFHRGSAFGRRQREREMEMDSDERDRIRERDELEDLRLQVRCSSSIGTC